MIDRIYLIKQANSIYQYKFNYILIKRFLFLLILLFILISFLAPKLVDPASTGRPNYNKPNAEKGIGAPDP